MIIIRDLTDVNTLKNKIRQGDILEIYRKRYDIVRCYWVDSGVLMVSYGDGECADYCYDSEFFRGIRVALRDPVNYFVKLIKDGDVSNVEVITLDEEAYI